MSFRDIKKDENWTIREIMGDDGVLLPRKYFYKRKEAPCVYISSKQAKQLAGYALIEKDLRSTLVWLNEIEKLTPDADKKKSQFSPNREVYNLVKGLWVASLTFYGKCFTSADGRGIWLDPKKFVDPEYRDLHSWVMHMRHNFAAHGGHDYEMVQVALVLYPDKRTQHSPILFKELNQADIAYDEDKKVSELIEHVRAKVLNKIEELDEKIMREEVFSKGKDYWYSKAKK